MTKKGAGTNLLSDRMASELRIPRRPLISPVEHLVWGGCLQAITFKLIV